MLNYNKRNRYNVILSKILSSMIFVTVDFTIRLLKNIKKQMILRE